MEVIAWNRLQKKHEMYDLYIILRKSTTDCKRVRSRWTRKMLSNFYGNSWKYACILFIEILEIMFYWFGLAWLAISLANEKEGTFFFISFS